MGIVEAKKVPGMEDSTYTDSVVKGQSTLVPVDSALAKATWRLNRGRCHLVATKAC